MTDKDLNLETLTPSRKKVKVGDIFVIKPKGHDYYFGCVISTTADSSFNKDAILLYIYNIKSNDKTNIPELNKELLLIPPLFINLLPWKKGFFETVSHTKLTKEDILKVLFSGSAKIVNSLSSSS